jgi:hypothetical protein
VPASDIPSLHRRAPNSKGDRSANLGIKLAKRAAESYLAIQADQLARSRPPSSAFVVMSILSTEAKLSIGSSASTTNGAADGRGEPSSNHTCLARPRREIGKWTQTEPDKRRERIGVLLYNAPGAEVPALKLVSSTDEQVGRSLTGRRGRNGAPGIGSSATSSPAFGFQFFLPRPIMIASI